MFKLTSRIVRRTELSYEKVLSILLSGISSDFQLFPAKIMTGRINGGKIKSVINPPTGWSDPFKSRVNGFVSHNNRRTNIELKISLGWVIIAFYIIWYSLLLFIFFGLIFFKDSDKSISTFAILVVFVLFPLGLGSLKVNWDKIRLEKWIDKKIETVPNKT